MEDLSEVKHITLGDLPVSEITLGDTVVWQRPSWEPETQDILDYADLNGYTKPSYRYIVELNFFIWNLKRFELWDEVHDLIYWMKGDGDLNFKTINLVNTAVGKGTPIGGLVNNITGVLGNAVDGYIETNFNTLDDGINFQGNNASITFDISKSYFSGVRTVLLTGSGSIYNIKNVNTSSTVQRLNHASNLPSVLDMGGIGVISHRRLLDDVSVVNKGDETIVNIPSLAVQIYSQTLRILKDIDPDGLVGSSEIASIAVGGYINYPQYQLLEWANQNRLNGIRNQETVDLIKYAIANDIKLPSIENLYQTDRRIHNLKKWGLWTNIFDVLYLLDGDGDIDFRSINIVNPDVSGTPYGGWIVDESGVKSNAIDGYIDTGFIPSVGVSKMQPDDTSIIANVIELDSTTPGAGRYIISSASQRVFLSGSQQQRLFGNTISFSTGGTSVAGFRAVSKYNNDEITLSILNSQKHETLPTIYLNFENQPIWINRSANTYLAHKLGLVSVGASLTHPSIQILSHIFTGDIEKIHNAETKAVIEYAMDMGYKLPTMPYLLKLDQFIQDVKERGLWDKFDVLYAMRGDVGQCAEFRCINLVNPNKSGTPMGGLIFTDLGVEGNAVDGYIDTEFNPNVGMNKYTIHNAHRTAYVYSDSATTINSSAIDSANGDVQNTLMIGNSITHRINSGGFNLNEAANLSGVGFKSIVRVNGTDVELVNNDILFSRTVTASVMTDYKQYIFRGRTVFSPNGLSTYSMGSAITFEESQLLRQAILKYVS